MNTAGDNEPGTGIVLPPQALPAGRDLSAFARAAIDAGMPANTRRNYQRSWDEFTRWCETETRCPLPATAETLAEFISWACYLRPVTHPRGHVVEGKTGVAPGTAEQMLWAVTKAHKLAEVPLWRDKALLVIQGYKDKLAKAHDPRAQPRQAKATTLKELPLLAEGAARSANPLIALRDRALVHANWVVTARVSELVHMNAEDFQQVPQGLLVSVYRRKGRKHGVAAIPEEEAPQAVAAIREWLAVLAEHGRIPGPMWPRITKSGTIGSPATRQGKDVPDKDDDGRIKEQAIERRIAAASELAGLGRRTAHSQRRGFATAARLAGHDKLDITRHGNAWADDSSSANRYFEDADKWSRNPLKGAAI